VLNEIVPVSVLENSSTSRSRSRKILRMERVEYQSSQLQKPRLGLLH
jgi:hypothetical protein